MKHLSPLITPMHRSSGPDGTPSANRNPGTGPLVREPSSTSRCQGSTQSGELIRHVHSYFTNLRKPPQIVSRVQMDIDARLARELEAEFQPHMRPIVPIAENCRVLLHTLEASDRSSLAGHRRAAEQGERRCTVLEETVPTTDAEARRQRR
jgi:hypothetical protein